MAPVTKPKQILGLIGWIVVTFSAAAVGGAASTQAGSFYNKLVLPDWAPAAWVFGPVWTLLYLLMGVAAWLVWRQDGFQKNRTALTLYLVQLALNGLWSWLFFAWRLGAWSFAEILMLWALIVATLLAFWKVRLLAGALLIPYVLWVSFASALNYSIWKLNPVLLG